MHCTRVERGQCYILHAPMKAHRIFKKKHIDLARYPWLPKALRYVHWGILLYFYGFFVAKATLEFGHPADVLAFYLPRALRYFGLTTYEYGAWAMKQAVGYPGLPSFIQGLMIWITGQFNAVNTINLIGFGIAVATIHLLYGKIFSARWFLTYCLAVPLFYYHITLGFIDLFASSMVLIAFAGLHSMNVNNKVRISAFVMILGCALAMLSKMTVWPAAMIIAGFGMVSIIKLRSARSLHLSTTILLATFLLLGIAFFPLRNFILFQNPTYPVELKPYMKTLPAVAVVSEIEELNIPLSLRTKNQAMSFLYSAFEMNRGNASVPLDWSSFARHGRPFERDQMGGFFSLTVAVLFVSLLYVSFVFPVSSLTLGTFLLIAVVCANMPHSAVLRYSLYLPLIGFFLLSIYHHLLPRHVKIIMGTAFAICILFVFPNLGNQFWQIDLSSAPNFAPAAARAFWKDSNEQPIGAPLTVQGGYPSTIYWAGPDFKTWNIREELETRFVIPVRRIDE